MEELRSTEILDKEIEADARKKADKILKNADSEAEKILADVETRVKEAKEQKEKYYDSKFNQFEKNLEAALPLEKERFLVSFYDDSVSSALKVYLKSIGAEKRLSLIEKRFSGMKKNMGAQKFNAFTFGIDAGAAKKLLGDFASSTKEISFEESGEEIAKGNEIHEGIILESENKKVRIRLTIDQIVRELKDKYSFELASTLFGGKLPQ